MGQRNRERRAAKQRARRREQRQARHRSTAGAHHEPRPGGFRPGWAGDTGRGWTAGEPKLVMDLAMAELLEAAQARAGGDARAATRGAAELSRGWLGAQPRWVDAAADAAVRDLVRAAADRGWLPIDLAEVTLRRLTPLAAGYVVDAVAEVSLAHAKNDRRWHQQLDDIAAVRWWSNDWPHLSQWATRHQCERADALTLVIEVLALLLLLPQLPKDSGSGSANRADEKMLARVRALLAKAESTGFADEAEALTAKAQELMSRYSLHRAMADHDHGTGQRPTTRRLWLDSPYVSAKSLLVNAVAEANRCRSVFSEHLGFVTVLGDEVDLDIVEVLTTSLLVQATTAMMAAGRQVDHARVSRTRSFRQSFLVSYAHRIGERLRGTAQAQVDATDDSRLLPVLAARSKAVDELFSSLFPALTFKSVSVSNAAGWGAGRAAADLARLDVFEEVESA